MPSSYGASLTPSLYTRIPTKRDRTECTQMCACGHGRSHHCRGPYSSVWIHSWNHTVCVTCSSRPGYVVFYQDQYRFHVPQRPESRVRARGRGIKTDSRLATPRKNKIKQVGCRMPHVTRHLVLDSSDHLDICHHDTLLAWPSTRAERAGVNQYVQRPSFESCSLDSCEVLI